MARAWRGHFLFPQGQHAPRIPPSLRQDTAAVHLCDGERWRDSDVSTKHGQTGVVMPDQRFGEGSAAP
eukprot:gene16890-biopygen5300